MEEIEKIDMYNRVVELLQIAKERVASAVNTTMVHTYFEIGRMIVEQEQQGDHRAQYGKAILKGLSERLTKIFGKGFSLKNLERMRQFYQIYAEIPQIVPKELETSKSSTVLRISETPKSSTLLTISKEPTKVFTLSWSHYLILMRIPHAEERSFYEIESYNNNWSLRELQRQFDSALYERLTLSRDKEAVISLAQKGQIIATPSDMVKDPYVLEFLGLPEQISYSENTLEHRLIDNLLKFPTPRKPCKHSK